MTADGSSGLGFLQFDAPSDGTYTVSVEEGSGTTGEILIGENIFAAAKSGLVVLVVVGTFGAVPPAPRLAVVVVALLAWMREAKSRSRSLTLANPPQALSTIARLYGVDSLLGHP